MPSPPELPTGPAGDVAAHYDAVSAGYHLQYERERLDTVEEYPANYFRLQILVNRLASLRAKRVYEIGVGEGTPLLTIAGMGVEVAGCDISEAMVLRARERLAQAGLPPSAVCRADAEDSVTFAHQLSDGPFDAVIAAGVLPHVANDSLFMQNTAMLLRPGGTALIEFRNKLFSLFTFNRKTREFIIEDLLAGVDAEISDAVAQELESRLAMELPAVRATLADGKGPGYDAIPAKFHNPFELVAEFQRHGFTDARIHWYHYHPAPPLLEPALGAAFRKAAFALEHGSSDWRGYFLCSAGVVETTKA